MIDPGLVALVLGIGGILGTLGGVVLATSLNSRQWRKQTTVQRKLDAINEFLVALMTSHRAVNAQIVFSNQSTPQAVDQKVENTVDKFQRASIYFDQPDYTVMESAWLKQKFFIACWMFNLPFNLVTDVNELNQKYNLAYGRLKDILRNP
jgi:hypothetical protein